jgi:hypothetical protein
MLAQILPRAAVRFGGKPALVTDTRTLSSADHAARVTQAGLRHPATVLRAQRMPVELVECRREPRLSRQSPQTTFMLTAGTGGNRDKGFICTGIEQGQGHSKTRLIHQCVRQKSPWRRTFVIST